VIKALAYAISGHCRVDIATCKTGALPEADAPDTSVGTATAASKASGTAAMKTRSHEDRRLLVTWQFLVIARQ
jgi:hypothetical protein